MCFLDKCTHFQAFLSPQPAIPLSMLHASFYSNVYNQVPCIQTIAKYPLWGNEEQNNIWCCLEQNAIKMITAPSFLHSFIHWYSLAISTYIPLQYLKMLKRVESATDHWGKSAALVQMGKEQKSKAGVAQANTCSGAVWAGSSCPIQLSGRATLVAGWQGSLSHPSPAMASPAQPWDRTLHSPAGHCIKQEHSPVLSTWS